MSRAKTALDHWRQAEAFGDDFNGSPCMALPNRTSNLGYVRLRCGGQVLQAHRMTYEALIGPIPEGLIPTAAHMFYRTNDEALEFLRTKLPRSAEQPGGGA